MRPILTSDICSCPHNGLGASSAIPFAEAEGGCVNRIDKAALERLAA
jgi:hypothetical protein